MSAFGYRLRDDVRIDPIYADETQFGSIVGGRIEQTVRRACRLIAEHRERHGMAYVVASSQALLRQVWQSELGQFFASPSQLREECLYPDATLVRPVGLRVSGEGLPEAQLFLDAATLAELAPWVGEIYRGTMRPQQGAGRRIFEALEACGALTSEPRSGEARPCSDVLFVGHATVASGRTPRSIVDPFFLPRSPRYPESYQPLRAADMTPVEAIFITHSHPDHFDLHSLLCLGSSAQICVPEVPRESLLSIDMAQRLEELGFSNVTRARAWQSWALAEGTAQALPFWGEQPTTGEVLHPDVRNQGCTYVLSARGQRTLFLADSGRDRQGDVRDLAAAVRARVGAVDVVFGGYRAFAIYPIHYLFSSVARYLLFVPESEWCVRQKTMNDGADLLETAERCGARYAVPYADGGAPWHWERGLGPRLDPSDQAAGANPAVDLPPESVVELSAERSSSREGPIASPVRVVVLRPGQGMTFEEDQIRLVHGIEQRWPYRRFQWLQLNVALERRAGSALESARVLFSALHPKLQKWRAEGILSCFFFMRKPPDLRLRFFGETDLLGRLCDAMDGLLASGAVSRWSQAAYEPETPRFGGEAGMAGAHVWFDVDSQAWIELDQIKRVGELTCSAEGGLLAPESLCLAIANDLVRRSLANQLQIHAVWNSYARALEAEPQAPMAHAKTGAHTSGSADTPRALLSPSANQIEPLGCPELTALEVSASAAVRDQLARYRAANERLAATLLELLAKRHLELDLGEVLVNLIQFHFHRHGLGYDAQLRLARRMAALLA